MIPEIISYSNKKLKCDLLFVEMTEEIKECIVDNNCKWLYFTGHDDNEIIKSIKLSNADYKFLFYSEEETKQYLNEILETGKINVHDTWNEILLDAGIKKKVPHRVVWGGLIRDNAHGGKGPQSNRHDVENAHDWNDKKWMIISETKI